jgi:hypothetical protein
LLLKFHPVILTLPPATPMPGSLVTTVVEAIERAYRENAPLQVAELGHDNWTYAVTIMKSIKHFLTEQDLETVVVEGHSLRLEVGGNRFYIHKLGRSEDDDPWSCFPGHAGPAGRAAEELGQLRLDLDLPQVAPRIYVIGHYGCLEDGLRAVRLQASGAADEGRIRSWTHVIDLYEAADEQAAAAATATPLPVGPAPVDVPEPALMPKRPAAATEADASGR